MSHPRNPNKRILYSRFKSDDEKIWDQAGIPVPHDYIRRPKTLARIARIRRIAAILFAEGGLAGICMHDIGRAAKIAPTSIAYYYSTRERLLHDVLIHHTDALLKVVEANFILHHEKDDPDTWLFDLTHALLRSVTHLERPGHRVLIHALHTLPDIERDEITHRLRSVRHAITQPLARLGGVDWADERLEPISHAYLAMLSQASIWFPATESPDKDAPALEAHARLLVQMGLAGTLSVRNTNAR